MSTKKRKNEAPEPVEVPKEAKSESTFPELDGVRQVQTQLDALHEGESKELTEVEKKWNVKKAPLVKQRNEKTKEVPDFWLKCFQNQRALNMFLGDADLPILQDMISLDVEDDFQKSWKLIFGFKDNSTFKNKTLIKEFHAEEDGQPIKVVSSKVEWKDPKYPAKNEASFFVSFMADDTEQCLRLADEIKDSIFKDPIGCYTGTHVHMGDDDDFEGDGGDGGEDGPDGADAGDGGDGGDGDAGEEE